MSWKEHVAEPIDRVDLNVNGLRELRRATDTRLRRRALGMDGQDSTRRCWRRDWFARSGDVRGDVSRSRFKTKEAALADMYGAMVRLDASGIKVVDSKETANEVYRVAKG